MMTKPVIILICCLLVNTLCVYSGYQWADNSWQSDWGAHMLADAEVNREAAEAALTKQQNLLQELDNAYKTANDLQKKHDINIADNRAANDRLRAEFDRLKAAMSEGGNSGTVISSAAAATDRLVLAQLLEQSHVSYGIVAEYADSNRKALINCANEYNAVRAALNER